MLSRISTYFPSFPSSGIPINKRKEGEFESSKSGKRAFAYLNKLLPSPPCSEKTDRNCVTKKGSFEFFSFSAGYWKREREKKKKKKGNQSNPSSPFCSWLGALLESRETSDSIITKGETAKANGTEWDALICLFRKEIKNRKRNSIRVLKLDFSISPLPQVAVVTIYGKSRVSS